MPLDARSATNRTEETSVGNFIADALRIETKADVALINGGTIRADDVLLPGELTRRDVLSILPFKNEVVVIEVTGSILLQALEHGVSRTAPGAEPSRFPQVSGLRFSFDASKAAGSRVSSVTVGGRPLDFSKTYTLATTSFIAGGGDLYSMFIGRPNVLKLKLTDTDVLSKAISSARDGINPRTDGRIRRLDRPAPQ